tara:strand:- start:19798 stop:20034 length:237 start_codon:yes stop_codon:yes gene_type:complete
MHYYNGKPVRTKCPYKYKWQLVDYVVKHLGFKKSKAQSMTKPQLFKMYYKYPKAISVTWAEHVEQSIIDDMINKARGK